MGCCNFKLPVVLTRILWTLGVTVAIAGAMVAGYALHWQAFDARLAAVGVYGIVIAAVMFLQFFFSVLNQVWTLPRLKKRAAKANFQPTVGAQVVGYREDPRLFAACLRDLKALQYNNLKGLVVCVDGNEGEPDQSMVNEFKKLFPEGEVLNLTTPIAEMSEVQKSEVMTMIGDQPKAICISQPHRGKRHAMYTAMFTLLHWNCELMLLTDSDTMLAANVPEEMVKPFVDPSVGAVCGDVKIYNIENWVSFFSSLRYWFAFNVERAAQSFWGTVTCVSGPIGMYRATSVRQIMDRWVNQKFLGVPCTYGDDRHLTNLILSRGEKVHYTPSAVCDTDTPCHLFRWIAQQTRWTKSFYRELLYNLRWVHKHSVWMAVELVVQAIYPFFLATTLVWLLAIHQLELLVLVPILAVIVNGARVVWALIRTRRIEFIYYIYYSVMYMTMIIPIKLFAIATLWNNDWSTSVRSAVVNSFSKAAHAILWAICMVGAYIGLSIWLAIDGNGKHGKFSWQVAGTAIGVATALSVLLLLWWTVGIFWYLPRKRREIQAKLDASATV